MRTIDIYTGCAGILMGVLLLYGIGLQKDDPRALATAGAFGLILVSIMLLIPSRTRQ